MTTVRWRRVPTVEPTGRGIGRPRSMVVGFMAQHMRILIAGAAAITLVGILGAVILPGGRDTRSNLPRVRVSVPGLDNDVDLFADESEPDRATDARSDVIEIRSVDQIRAAFEGDEGRPRLILLVDPL